MDCVAHQDQINTFVCSLGKVSCVSMQFAACLLLDCTSTLPGTLPVKPQLFTVSVSSSPLKCCHVFNGCVTPSSLSEPAAATLVVCLQLQPLHAHNPPIARCTAAPDFQEAVRYAAEEVAKLSGDLCPKGFRVSAEASADLLLRSCMARMQARFVPFLGLSCR